MSTLETLFLIVYFLTLFVLSFYGAHRYQMVWLYYKNKKNPPPSPPVFDPFASDLPFVLIQLPIFNERYVVERLIHQVCQIRYPRSHLLIQVLDDSIDDSVDIARTAVEQWALKGEPIKYHHRTDRLGFKAGALQAGMKEPVHADLIAVFDADFLPNPDFLEMTTPYFNDQGVGMVQTRWDHINRTYSLLTQAQGILLDGHFMIEHTARHRSGRFFNFNGTAGVWRKLCIEEAGGWEHDTLTEDLDLSYRAQLKGWKFIFLNEILSPAELPIEMNAFKNQQHRWAKGSIQVALKILPRIFKSNQPLFVKYEAFVHLTANLAYVMMIALSLMLPFALRIRINHGWRESILIDLPFFLGATISVCIFYILSQMEVSPNDGKRRLWFLPAVLGIGIGLAVNNTKATLEALFGHQSPFVRTPKWAADHKKLNIKQFSSLYRGGRGMLPLIEIFFGLYYSYTVYYCIIERLWVALPFMILFQWGFLYIGLMSLFQWSLWSLKEGSSKEVKEEKPIH